MSIKITFQNMQPSELLEQHIHKKIERLLELLQDEASSTPFLFEFWLKAHAQHAHHAVEFHLRTKHFNHNAHESDPDMYLAVDNVIDTMTKLVKKEKEKMLDRHHKQENEKKIFSKD